VLSWAIVGGGRRVATDVVWREVMRGELGPEVDPAALLRRALADAGLPDAIGLLTARDVRTFDVAEAVDPAGGGADAALRARCVATVGLANALAAGDPPGTLPTVHAGTVNVCVSLSVPLTDEALLEALALAAEARTAAMLEARLPSPLSGRPASGTGTDCIVVAAPVAPGGAYPAARLAYAGKHTRVGSVLGAAVRDAVARGIARWLEEARCAKRP
jgi:adenosylcobinamide amidohydrolase